MPWTEFSALLSGLNEDTPFGRMVQIRAETRGEVIKSFTPAQKLARNEWRSKEAKRMAKQDPEGTRERLSSLQSMLKAQFGGGAR